MNKSKIVHNVFSASEISQLVNYYADQPYTVERFTDDNKLKYRNKNNSYDIEHSLPYKILRSKLTDVLGEHTMQYGAYLESHSPFSVHVDTNTEFKNLNLHRTSDNNNQNLAVLIPLSENPYFKTIFFDHFADHFETDTVLPKVLQEPHDLGVDLAHLKSNVKEKIQWIPIDKIFQWKIGDVAIWTRNQLHCASNFLPSNTYKTAITIFV